MTEASGDRADFVDPSYCVRGRPMVAGGVLDRAFRELHGVAPHIDSFRGLKTAAGRVALGLEPNHPLF